MSRALVIAAVAAILAIGACSDSPTGPGAVWVAAETGAALQIRGELPTLPAIVERARSEAGPGEIAAGGAADAAYRRALRLWRAAEAASGSPERARTLRERAYRTAADELAGALDSATLGALHADLDGWLDVAASIDLPRDMSDVAETVRRARFWLDRARSLDAVDRVASIRATLRTADHLAALTPPAVARRLIRRADARVTAVAAGDGPPSGRTLNRAERLLAGARDALEAGEPIRAIRRAYYAARLLEPR